MGSWYAYSLSYENYLIKYLVEGCWGRVRLDDSALKSVRSGYLLYK